jgi:hypothetical protein
MSYSIVGVSSLCFHEMNERFAEKHKMSTRDVTKLYYGRPSPLPPTAIGPINEHARWVPVSVPVIQMYGFTHYAWIKPSEFLGDHVFPKSGGFAYLHEAWKDSHDSSMFFPLVTPSECDPHADEDERAKVVHAMDIDETSMPRAFVAYVRQGAHT